MERRSLVTLGWVSIHAPVKGATFAPRAEAYTLHRFNSRSREGSDVVGRLVWGDCVEFQFTLP